MGTILVPRARGAPDDLFLKKKVYRHAFEGGLSNAWSSLVNLCQKKGAPPHGHHLGAAREGSSQLIFLFQKKNA